MDLSLALTYQEQNDNTALILTDTTTNWDSETTSLTSGDTLADATFYEIVTRATVDFMSYGASSNAPGTRFVSVGTVALGAGDEIKPVTPAVTEITALTLNTTVKTSDTESSIKDQVNLLSEFGPFATQDDMVFTIDADLFGDTPDSELDDGLYAFAYIVTFKGAGGANSLSIGLTKTILVYGQVKVLVYDKVRQISTNYLESDGAPSSELSEADLCGAYLSCIEASGYTAKTEELLDMISVLNNIVANGSGVTW